MKKSYSSQTEMERNLLKGEVRRVLRELSKYYYDEESEKYKIFPRAYNEMQQDAHKVLLETLSDLKVECIDNEDRKLLEEDFNQAVNDFDENVELRLK